MSKIGGVLEVNSIDIDGVGKISWPQLKKATLFPDDYGALVTDAYTFACSSDQAVPIVGRHHVSLAEMNAGHTILPAVPNLGYRVSDLWTITWGSNMAATAAATGIAVYGTFAGAAAAIFTVLLAAGTRSTICRPGLANTSILADGASFVRADYNTAITCKTVSAGAFDLITSSFFDVNVLYTLER